MIRRYAPLVFALAFLMTFLVVPALWIVYAVSPLSEAARATLEAEQGRRPRAPRIEVCEPLVPADGVRVWDAEREVYVADFEDWYDCMGVPTR